MIKKYPIKIEPVFLDWPNENEVDYYRVFIYFNDKENFYIEKEGENPLDKNYTTDLQRIWKYNIIKAAFDKGNDLISIKFNQQKGYQICASIEDLLFNSDCKIDHKTIAQLAVMLDTPEKTLLDTWTKVQEDIE